MCSTMRLIAAVLLSLACLVIATPAAAAGHAWTPVAKVPGIFDIGGPRQDGWIVDAIDCNGSVENITRSAPRTEGGIEVAPKDFGAFGGALIAPDELGGNIYAIAADGSSKVVLASGLPAGGDIGVESAGFIPPGMDSGGEVFYSDRLTPG